jgi:hypothetical protein
MEEDNNYKINIEKPKKVKREITEKQRETLAKARATRQAKKILGMNKTATKTATNISTQQTIQQPIQQSIQQPIQQPIQQQQDYTTNFIRLSEEIQVLKQMMLEKKRLKEQKEKTKNTIDIQSHDEEKEKLKEMERLNYIKTNFLR